jgi:hypothetical protein
VCKGRQGEQSSCFLIHLEDLVLKSKIFCDGRNRKNQVSKNNQAEKFSFEKL